MSFIGAGMLLTGIVLRVWSINILGRHFTATVKVIDKHELIKIGPYKIVRHPSYLGALISITGCPLFLNNFYTCFFCFCHDDCLLFQDQCRGKYIGVEIWFRL